MVNLENVEVQQVEKFNYSLFEEFDFGNGVIGVISDINVKKTMIHNGDKFIIKFVPAYTVSIPSLNSTYEYIEEDLIDLINGVNSNEEENNNEE